MAVVKCLIEQNTNPVLYILLPEGMYKFVILYRLIRFLGLQLSSHSLRSHRCLYSLQWTLKKKPNKARIFSKINTIIKLDLQLCLRRSKYPFNFENHLVYICMCVVKTYLSFLDIINVDDKKNNFIVGSTWNTMMFPPCRRTLTKIIEFESIRQIVN